MFSRRHNSAINILCANPPVQADLFFRRMAPARRTPNVFDGLFGRSFSPGFMSHFRSSSELR